MAAFLYTRIQKIPLTTWTGFNVLVFLASFSLPIPSSSFSCPHYSPLTPICSQAVKLLIKLTWPGASCFSSNFSATSVPQVVHWMMAQIICQSQREETEQYNVFSSSTELCHPKVAFQTCLIPVPGYYHPARVADAQEGRSVLTLMFVSIAPTVLNSSVLARAVAAGERGCHHTPIMGLLPCSHFLTDLEKWYASWCDRDLIFR